MKLQENARLARQRTRQLEQSLKRASIPPRPRNGWVAAIREALGMSKTQLAHRMDISRPGLTALETRELSGAITIKSLERVANALDCEFQYVLVPKRSLADIIRRQALRRAEQTLGRVNESQALEASSIKKDPLSSAILDLAKELEVGRSADLWRG